MKPNQLSNTAAFIAVKFYGLTREDPCRSLFDDEIIRFYDRLVQQLPAPLRFYHRGLRYKPARRFFTFWEELLLPGDLMHIILRKRYLGQWVEQLRKQGYRQMLVLGGGFDHLAALGARTGMRCLEIDTPAMTDMKQSFIDTCGYAHKNLMLREAFFGPDSLHDVLAKDGRADSDTNADAHRLDRAKKTIVVAEGFFDYFSVNESAELLTDLNAIFSGGVQLLSTLNVQEELSGFRSFVYKKSVMLAGEKLKLGLNRDQFVSLLESHQFRSETIIDRERMRREVLELHDIEYPVLGGFYLVRAELSV
jgi:O-methyltransferase involved in polyketide biosynthesis